MRSSDFVAAEGSGYQKQMGRWSRLLAVPFADFAGQHPGERILDMGCGTGSLTTELERRDETANLIGLDYSKAYTSYAAAHGGDASRFLVGDGCALPFADDTFDRGMSLLVLHFVPDPDRAIREVSRVTRPGCVIAAAVWDAAGGVQANRLFCDAAAAVAPGGEAFRQKTFSRPLIGSGELLEAWQRAMLLDVVGTTLTIRMEFEDFADYWAPYIAGDGPYAPFVSSLDGPDRETLANAVRQAYIAGGPDGPRSFTASAWAVRGRVPPDGSVPVKLSGGRSG